MWPIDMTEITKELEKDPPVRIIKIDSVKEMDNEELLVAGQDNIPEVFYTVEGEGEYIGYPSVFLRLSGCNLTCKGFASKDSPNGCDSYVSWSIKNRVSFKALAELLEREGFKDKLLKGAIWKITGGEPTMQWKKLVEWFRYILARWGNPKLRIDFETNGTIAPGPELFEVIPDATFTVSPKLASNGDPLRTRFREDVLAWHVFKGSGFKFVIQTEADIKEIMDNYVSNVRINMPLNRIWFMPCCGSQKELLERGTQVAEWAKDYVVKFSNRMHLQLWDKALRV